MQAEWRIDLQQASGPVAVTGRLTWIPGLSPAPWLAVAAGLLALGLVLGLTRRWGALAGAVALVTVNDVFHAVATAWSWSGDAVYRATRLIDGNSFSIAGWVVGVVAFGWLRHQRADGLYAAALAGASAFLFTGLLDFGVLGRSQAPFNGPLALDRATVAISLGLGLGVVLGALAGVRVNRASPAGDDCDTEECAPAERPAIVPRSA